MAESLYRCGIYVRVSTEEQAENPEGSIKNQEQRLREFVKLKNLVAPFGEVAGVYSDPGFSAKDMNRPGFQRLLKSIERREINLILVTELSRLTRSMKDFGLLQEFLIKSDCEFLSLRENFDTSSATGGMVLNIMASISEFERRQTAERISQAFLARAKRGLYNGGSVPVGYSIDPDRKGNLVIVAEEATLVKLVFETFLKKETMAGTAKWLNQEKIELPATMRGGGNFRSGIFRIDTIHKILRNPIYAGIRAYRVRKGPGFVTEQTKAIWEPIIDPDTFDRVQELLTKNRYRKRTHLNQRFPFTLSGVMYCQTCGQRMSGKSAHGKAGKIPYYEHAWASKHHGVVKDKRPQCTPYRIQAVKIEPVVWRDAKLFLTRVEFVQELLENAKRATPENDKAQQQKRLEQTVQILAKQIEVLAGRIAKLPESLDPTALYGQMESLQKAKLEAETKCDEQLLQRSSPHHYQNDEPVSLESLQTFTAGFKKLLTQGDTNPEIRAAIIRKLVHRIEIMKDGYEIYFHLGQGHFEREFSEWGTKLSKATLETSSLQNAKNKKGGLDTTRPPSKPLQRFFLDRCSKRLENGG